MQGGLTFDVSASSNRAGNDEALDYLGEGNARSSCPSLLDKTLEENHELTRRLSRYEDAMAGNRNALAVQELGAARGTARPSLGEGGKGIFSSMKKRAVQATKAATKQISKAAVATVSKGKAVSKKARQLFSFKKKVAVMTTKVLSGLEVN